MEKKIKTAKIFVFYILSKENTYELANRVRFY